MVSPDSKIERYRDDEVQPSEDRFLKKDKTPTRNFGDIAAQIDEKRYQEEEQKKLDKKNKKPVQAARTKEEADEHPPSIFDLVKNTKQHSDKDDDEQSKSQVDMIDEEDLALKKRRNASTIVDRNERIQNNPEFVPEQRDLSYVNPLAAAAPTTATTLNSNAIKSTAPVAPVQNIQEIIDRIAKEVSALEMNGKSETVVTLKGPLFDQSRLILTQFDSAKGQFNITIDNLTQAAKNVLDMNQNTLIENLSKKGYMVHIVTTTTTLEATQVDVSQLSQEDSKQNNQEQGKRDKEQESEER